MLEKNPWLRALIVLLVIAVGLHVAGLLWDIALRFGDVIILFIVAWLLAFVLRPLARQAHVRYRVPWSLSVAGVYLIFFGLVVILGIVLVPPLITQLALLAVAIPAWLQDLTLWYQSIQGTLPEPMRMENWSSILGQRDLIAQLQQVVTGLLQNAIGLAAGVASAMLGLALVLV
ncbi:MAG: AI-2E family transporter, partial [Chloroflexota bacterium]